MPRLSFYLFRQLLTGFVFASAAVTLVVLFTQLFRLLSLVIDNASSLWIFFELMALTVPTFLPLVLPISLGISVLFVFHKLAVDSELVVMRAAGVSPLRQALPAVLLSVLVALFCYALTLWLTPMANRQLVAIQYQVRNDYAVLLSRPGNFNDMAAGVTFYAHSRGPEGTLEGIFMHDVRKPDMPVTIMAEAGRIDDGGGVPKIIVYNGRRQELDRTTGKLAELSFQQYVIGLDDLRSTATSRLADPREQTVTELLNPSVEMLKSRASREHLRAEFHQRLASPLLALAYTLMGLVALLVGDFNRRGMGPRILVAVLALVTVQASMMSVNSAAAHHEELVFLFYLWPVLTVVGAFILLYGAGRGWAWRWAKVAV